MTTNTIDTNSEVIQIEVKSDLLPEGQLVLFEHKLDPIYMSGVSGGNLPPETQPN